MPPNLQTQQQQNLDDDSDSNKSTIASDQIDTEASGRKSSTISNTMNNVLHPQRRKKQSSLRWNKKVTNANCLRPLVSVAQEYAWGRIGSSSTVARMKEAADLTFDLDEGAPYAELWLGTHPSGMCSVIVPDSVVLSLNQPESHPMEVDATSSNNNEAADDCRSVSLLEYVQSDPALHMGHKHEQDLQFLLKILSVRKVLSIQAHPDKRLAEQLHAIHPNVYKDDNHKPEMAIALSERVRAMFGFRPLDEIAQHLQEYPEFQRLIGPAATEQVLQVTNRLAARSAQKQQQQFQHHGLFHSKSKDEAEDEEIEQLVKTALRNMFHDYITAHDDTIRQAVDDMLLRLRTISDNDDESNSRPSTPTFLEDVPKLMFQLHEQFPGDCGIFAPLIFNILQMSKGEALFIDANEPHAYISGEIIECMACSDNVVRAGLTPKLKDVPTLVNMLTYKTCRPETTFGEAIDSCTTRYIPPVQDFCVEQIVVPANARYEIANVNSPSVLLVIEGDGKLEQERIVSLPVSFGVSTFCSAGTAVTVIAGEYGMTLTRACNNVFYG
ncbi:hypothetical protein MPSEU_000579800 [Mayamaea pseudoterrestris]|nr:hypothetical protein MPSEU_000579800 [Mayamaea pseudoterrestris]